MKKFNNFNKLAGLFLTAVLQVGCASTGGAARPGPAGPGPARASARAEASQDLPQLRLTLGQDRLGRPTKMLTPVWPSHGGGEYTDRWGRRWTMDKEGRVQMPEKLTLGYFAPPSPETYPFDALLASHLIAMGQESRGASLLLSMLRVASPMRDQVREYFCSVWKGWQERGATWEALLGAVVALEYASGKRITVENAYHGFAFDAPEPWLWGGARVPVPRGEALLMTLAPLSGKYNVLVVSVDEPSVLCAALRVQESGCDLRHGRISFSQERSGALVTRKLGEITVGFVVIGDGPSPSSLASTLRRVSYTDPCGSAGQ